MNLAFSCKRKLVLVNTFLLICVSFCLNAAAEALPDNCIQLPQRSTACPNIVYKRAPIDLPSKNIKQGAIICVCMADFTKLRVEAESEVEKVSQSAELSLKSRSIGINEKELLTLIRN